MRFRKIKLRKKVIFFDFENFQFFFILPPKKFDIFENVQMSKNRKLKMWFLRHKNRIFFELEKKYIFLELEFFGGYSFDVKTSDLLIYDGFRAFWARQMCFPEQSSCAGDSCAAGESVNDPHQWARYSWLSSPELEPEIWSTRYANTKSLRFKSTLIRLVFRPKIACTICLTTMRFPKIELRKKIIFFDFENFHFFFILP